MTTVVTKATRHALAGAVMLGSMALAAPLAAQGEAPPLVVPWGANGTQPFGPEGQKMCMIWAGKTQPMFNFTVMENLSHRRPLLNMAAPWLEGQADLSPVAVSVSFPDGSTFEGRGVYGAEKNVTSTRMDSLEAVLAGFSRPGVISITIGGTTHQYDAPWLKTAIVAMRECAAALPPVARP